MEILKANQVFRPDVYGLRPPPCFLDGSRVFLHADPQSDMFPASSYVAVSRPLPSI